MVPFIAPTEPVQRKHAKIEFIIKVYCLLNGQWFYLKHFHYFRHVEYFPTPNNQNRIQNKQTNALFIVANVDNNLNAEISLI